MFVYRMILSLAALPVAGWLTVRRIRGQDSRSDLRQRLGLDGPPKAPRPPVIWIHGASNGELTSARDLIESLLNRDPAMKILVTANSLTGRDLVRSWALPRLHARLAPLDYRATLGAFLQSHQPTGLVLLEGDLWPNRIVVSAARGIPVAMVSARISERSARKWQRMSGTASSMMDAVALLSPQDVASADRFMAMGLARNKLRSVMTLKSTVTMEPPDPEMLHRYREIFVREDTLLAASTHQGEEAEVIAAFLRAREDRPDLRMILAPRHSARGDEVAALLEQSGLPFGRRSEGAEPGRGQAVYLADTMGEMALWYSLSGQCFVGGSLVPKGGHTPYEPAQFGCAILHGPDLSNFAETYELLADAGGAVRVETADMLGAELAVLGPDRRAALAEASQQALAAKNATFRHLVDDLCRTFGIEG